MSQSILCMDKGLPGQNEALQEAGFTLIRPGAPDPEAIIRQHSAEIKAITTVLTPVRRALIEALPNLEIIATGAVGFDHINLEAAAARDIAVTNTPDVLTDDTADMGILLMMAVMRRLVEGDAFVRAGLWNNGPLPLGTTLSGKRVGIVGLGRIGKVVAQRAEAFGMNICYFGPREKTEEPYPYYDDLEALARDCDVLMLTCPGGTRTKHLVNYGILEALGPSGFVVNIARGSVIKEADLLAALSNKVIAGAGLDVYDNEPIVPPPLMTLDNVVLAPHIGSATRETRTAMGRLVAGNIKAHFAGDPLLTPVKLG